MNRYIACMLMLLVLMIPQQLFSQQRDSVFFVVDEVIASSMGGFGAKQMAMGGAGIMSIDGAALFYNPANLARVPRLEFNLGLSFQKFKDNSSTRPLGESATLESQVSKTSSHLNSSILTIPYPTYRGSLVFGAGVARTADFDRISIIDYREGDWNAPEETNENGGINQWGFGFGFDLSPRISFGSAVYLYYGKHKRNFDWNLYQDGNLYDPYSLYEENKYSGLGIKLGLSMQLSRHFALGMTTDLPVSYNVEQDAVESFSDSTIITLVEYDLKKPFIYAMGLSSRFDRLTVLADIEYVDWTQLAYADNIVMEQKYNDDFLSIYRDVFKLRLGGEYVIPAAGLSLRGGYFIDPLPYKKQFFENDRDGFTFGIGLLVDQVLMLDFAYVRGAFSRHAGAYDPDESDNIFTYEYELTEETNINRFHVTASYRF